MHKKFFYVKENRKTIDSIQKKLCSNVKSKEYDEFRSEIKKIMNDDEYFLIRWNYSKCLRKIKKTRLIEIYENLNNWFWRVYTNA